MNWHLAAFASLVCWAAAYVVACKAGHNGAAINVVLEAAGALIVALVAGRGITAATFKENGVTVESVIYGVAAGVLTAVGLYIYLVVLEKVPEHISETVAIAGLNPVLAVVMLALIYKIAPKFIAEASPLQPIQWAGVALAGVALILITWDARWTERLKLFFN